MVIGLLVVFGFFAPILSFVFGLEGGAWIGSLLPSLLVLFAAAFSFYFGGMAAAYHARTRRRLHGTLVGVVAGAASLLANLLGVGAGTQATETPGLIALYLLVIAVSIAAATVGGKRGEALYAYNRKFSPPEKTSRKPSRRRDGS